MKEKRQNKDDFYIFGLNNLVEQFEEEQVWRGWISGVLLLRCLLNMIIIVSTL
jgi:hypothetical protein